MSYTCLVDNSEKCQGSIVTKRALKFMLENICEEIKLDHIAEATRLSKFNLCREFHRRIGMPPMRWLWEFRARLAAEHIRATPDWNITDIAFACGFGSSAHFSRTFHRVMGCTATKYRNKFLNSNALKRKLRVVNSTPLTQDLPLISSAFRNTLPT